MKRLVRLLVPLLVLFLPCVAKAEVKIAMVSRMKNRPPGRCGWCALETLARHHGIKILYGLVDSNASQSRPKDLEKVLDDFKVSYRIQARGCFDRDILREAINKDLGAVVGLREQRPGAGGHIVTLIDYDADSVRIIDPNDQDCRTRTLPTETFLRCWDGFALVLLKPAEVVAETTKETAQAKKK